MRSSKHLLTILLAFFLCQFSYAQQDEETGSEEYNNALKTFRALYEVDNSNIAAGLKGAESLIKKGESSDEYMISCLGYELKGRMLYRQNKIDESLAEIAKWRELAFKNENYEQYFKAYYAHCDYEKYFHSVKALVMGEKMIAEAKKLKYMPGLVWAHEMQGNLTLYIIQDFPTASSHYQSAIEIASNLQFKSCPDMVRLYTRYASSLGEEHKFAESERVISNLKSMFGNRLRPDQELNILLVQMDNAYNAKANASVYDQAYQRVVNHPLFKNVVFSEDNCLFYKVRWLIRTGRGQEALENIPHLALAIDRFMLSSDAYESIGEWRSACYMKDSVEVEKDKLMHELRIEELVELDAELKNSELTIESAENKARFEYTILGCVSFVVVVTLAIIAYIVYRRRKYKLEAERKNFVRNVTHQLRTPMTVVTGMVEQLRDHIPEGDAVGIETLEATKRQSRKLQELIMQLAHMSKMGMAPLLDKNGDLATSTVFASTPRDSKEIPVLPSDTDKPSILLAEDTDDVAMMMSGYLQKNGYVVTRAVDGQEALDMLQHELPDLLITDIAMPRMDGLQLMRNIRKDETMCHLPIIVASARVEDSERMEGISAGAEVYLTKPFIPEELLLRVQTMLQQRERLRRSFANGENEKEAKVETVELTAAEKNFIDAVDKCIDDNMKSEINVNVIAETVFSSVSTISRRIKNITGMTAAAYIRARRIIKAKHLLTTTQMSVSEVELECGFSTPGHFSRVFKAETGMSPSEYRQINLMS